MYPYGTDTVSVPALDLIAPAADIYRRRDFPASNQKKKNPWQLPVPVRGRAQHDIRNNQKVTKKTSATALMLLSPPRPPAPPAHTLFASNPPSSLARGFHVAKPFHCRKSQQGIQRSICSGQWATRLSHRVLGTSGRASGLLPGHAAMPIEGAVS